MAGSFEHTEHTESKVYTEEAATRLIALKAQLAFVETCSVSERVHDGYNETRVEDSDGETIEFLQSKIGTISVLGKEQGLGVRYGLLVQKYLDALAEIAELKAESV